MTVKTFTPQFRNSVAALGEEELIAAIRRWLANASPRAPFGIGDDCAVLPRARAPQLLTVDPVVHNRHFDDSVPPRMVGAKLLKRNLSDLAAMGGRPSAAVVSLIMGGSVDVRWLEQFYRGLAACAREYRVPIVGGDVTQADGGFAASLTLLGEATGPRVLTRVGAQLGDWIYTTGVLGGSRGGHHFRFTPRLAEGAWLARRAAVRSMMDLSDGLAKDLHALTPRGACAAILPGGLPRRPGASVEAALTDGEDYELVFTYHTKSGRAAFERAWRGRFPATRLTCIGQFARAGKLPSGAVDLARFHGYEHLSAAPARSVMSLNT
ncbi:MAG: thiamine-monophosphate kinase [Verrucomicrobia bacterium]|nr:thiamine-monophosphate kinase [Verrucomicrobiota bacterium]